MDTASILKWLLQNIIENVSILLTGFLAWRNIKTEIKASRTASLEMFNLQKKKEDAQNNLPRVIEILGDLDALQQAFIYRGSFIRGVEHRCPTIQLKDGEKEGEMSIAERTHQLHQIAMRIVDNCRRIIFLTPEGMIPETLAVCKQIRDSFLEKKAGQRRYFEIRIGNIGTILQRDNQRVSKPTQNEEQGCDDFVGKLEKFQVELETRVQEEFPTCALDNGHFIFTSAQLKVRQKNQAIKLIPELPLEFLEYTI